MARIRSIHPGILTDEAFMTLTVECPLGVPLLVGIWMQADDAGVFEWKPITLKAAILPGISTEFGHILAELVRNSFVRCFDVDGRQYGVVRNFVKYQRPKKPKDQHPATPEMRSYAGFEDGKRPHADTGRPPNDDEFGTSSGIHRQMKEEGGRRKEEKKDSDASARADKTPSPPPIPRSTTIDPDCPLSTPDRDAAISAGLTRPQAEAEWQAFVDFNLAKAERSFNWPASWRKWLHNGKKFERPDHGRNGKPSVQTAARGNVESGITFGPVPPPYMPGRRGSEESGPTPRLLSQGGGGGAGDLRSSGRVSPRSLPAGDRLPSDGPEIGDSRPLKVAPDRG